MGISEAQERGIGITVSDVSGQRTATVEDVPADATISDLVNGILGDMSLPRNDPTGQPLTYQARLEREGRLLNGSEVVNKALRESDHVVLQPNVNAG